MEYHTLATVRDGLRYNSRDELDLIETYPELQADPTLATAAAMIRIAKAAVKSRIEELYNQCEHPDD